MPAPQLPKPARRAHAHAARCILRRLRFDSCSAALLLTLSSCAALAQVSGSVALLSDYRFRGVSLSNGKPVAQAGVAYDAPQRWYAGGLVSAVLAGCFPDCGGLQGVVYAGYAARQSNGLAFDVGGD